MTAPLTPADLAALRALADKATPGPWRWELNLKHKALHLCGGVPRFDLTVIDFQRWGMSGAMARLRNPEGGLDMMRPAQQFAVPVPGREHHSDWFQTLDHPDASFIAAAREALPRLLDALEASEAEVVGWKANHAAAEEGWMKAASERDAARAEVARLAEGYRVSELNRARAEAEVERLRGARTALYDALVLLVEWGARGHNPKDIAPWIRATQVLKDARAVLGEEGTR